MRADKRAGQPHAAAIPFFAMQQACQQQHRGSCGGDGCCRRPLRPTVKLFCRIFSVSQSTLRLVLQKMTACRAPRGWEEGEPSSAVLPNHTLCLQLLAVRGARLRSPCMHANLALLPARRRGPPA